MKALCQFAQLTRMFLLSVALTVSAGCSRDRYSRLSDDQSAIDSSVYGFQNELEEFVAAKMARHHVPGVAIGIVKLGKTSWSKGFGRRNDDASNNEVNENTLFAIGSISKSFTALQVGRLVDQGLVHWETPIREYYPALRFFDEITTDQVTFVDLMTHRTGLPRHDLVWYGRHTTGPQAIGRADLVKAIRWLEPSMAFRSGWQYQNLMFNLAGFVTEQVTGKSWENQIRDDIFAPLHMNRSNFSVSAMVNDNNAAKGFRYLGAGEPVVIPYRNIDAIGPAGSINSSAVEMNRYVEMLLNSGNIDGSTIVSPATHATITGPHSIIDRDRGHPAFSYHTYGLGWMVYQYRGKSVYSHGGAIDGFKANITILPDEGFGIVVLSNAGHRNITELIGFRAIDLALGLEPIEFDPAASDDTNSPPALDPTNPAVPNAPQPLPGRALAEYVGQYVHPAYGSAVISVVESEPTDGNASNQQLAVLLNDLGPADGIQRNQYDAFYIGVARPEPGMRADKIMFQTDFDGQISQMAWPLEDGVAPIIFKKVRP